MKTSFGVGLTFATLLLLPATWAQDVYWTDATGDHDYVNSDNWTGVVPARVPGDAGNLSDNAWITNSSGVPAQLSGSAPTLNSVIVGANPDGGAAVLSVLPGAVLNTTTLTAGYNNGSGGLVDLRGGTVTAGGVYSGGLEGGFSLINVTNASLSATGAPGIRIAWGVDGDSVVNDTSGSRLSVSGTGSVLSSHGITVGGPVDPNYDDAGYVDVSDSASLSWDENFSLRNGSIFTIEGSGAAITALGAGSVLSLLGADTIEFKLDSAGVATVDLDNNEGLLDLAPTSIISIDGSAYAGGSISLTLIAHKGYANASVFGTVDISGFSPQYMADLAYGPNSVTLNVDWLPEPSAMGLMFLGGAALGFVRRRRSGQ